MTATSPSLRVLAEVLVGPGQDLGDVVLRCLRKPIAQGHDAASRACDPRWHIVSEFVVGKVDESAGGYFGPALVGRLPQRCTAHLVLAFLPFDKAAR